MAADTGTRITCVEDSYTLLQKLGEGSFGSVYKAQHKRTNQVFAIKKSPLGIGFGPSQASFQEISILREFTHKNIVKLFDVIRSKSDIHLVLEYCDYDLHKFMTTHGEGPSGSLPNDLTLSFTLQLMTGVDYLHKNNMIHRDLKPDNILLDHNGVLKIADFGISIKVLRKHEHLSPKVAALYYRPPEVLLGSCVYGTEFDIWACGCIFAEMLYGRRPFFMGRDARMVLRSVVDIIGIPCGENWQIFRHDCFSLSCPCQVDLLSLVDYNVVPWLVKRKETGVLSLAEQLLWSMLKFDPLERISAEKALLGQIFKTSFPGAHGIGTQQYQLSHHAPEATWNNYSAPRRRAQQQPSFLPGPSQTDVDKRYEVVVHPWGTTVNVLEG